MKVRPEDTNWYQRPFKSFAEPEIFTLINQGYHYRLFKDSQSRWNIEIEISQQDLIWNLLKLPSQ